MLHLDDGQFNVQAVKLLNKGAQFTCFTGWYKVQILTQLLKKDYFSVDRLRAIKSKKIEKIGVSFPSLYLLF